MTKLNDKTMENLASVILGDVEETLEGTPFEERGRAVEVFTSGLLMLEAATGDTVSGYLPKIKEYIDQNFATAAEGEPDVAVSWELPASLNPFNSPVSINRAFTVALQMHGYYVTVEEEGEEGVEEDGEEFIDSAALDWLESLLECMVVPSDTSEGAVPTALSTYREVVAELAGTKQIREQGDDGKVELPKKGVDFDVYTFTLLNNTRALSGLFSREKIQHPLNYIEPEDEEDPDEVIAMLEEELEDAHERIAALEKAEKELLNKVKALQDSLDKANAASQAKVDKPASK